MPAKIFTLFTTSFMILALCGCTDTRRGGGGDDDDGANCPDLSGEWVMVEHCSDPLVGAEYTVTQTGCSLNFEGPAVEEVWEASITADGVFTSTVVINFDDEDDETELMHCNGTGSEVEISFICDNDEACSGRLERPSSF